MAGRPPVDHRAVQSLVERKEYDHATGKPNPGARCNTCEIAIPRPAVDLCPTGICIMARDAHRAQKKAQKKTVRGDTEIIRNGRRNRVQFLPDSKQMDDVLRQKLETETERLRLQIASLQTQKKTPVAPQRPRGVRFQLPRDDDAFMADAHHEFIECQRLLSNLEQNQNSSKKVEATKASDHDLPKYVRDVSKWQTLYDETVDPATKRHYKMMLEKAKVVCNKEYAHQVGGLGGFFNRAFGTKFGVED